MKSLTAILADLSAVKSELDQHIKLHSNKTAAHADALEIEVHKLKEQIKFIKKSQAVYKGLYQKKVKLVLRLQDEVNYLGSVINRDDKIYKEKISDLTKENADLRTQLIIIK